MTDTPNERRLRLINLHYLERRRLRGDLIKSYNKGNVNKILRISNQNRTKNNGFQLEKSKFKKEIG